MKIEGMKDTINWYDKNADNYAKSLYEVAPMDAIEAFIKHLPKNAHILEAGCGPGRESVIFKKKGIKTTGVDLSQELLRIAEKNNPGVEYIKTNFLNLPLKNNIFDGIWAHASLVHLETILDVQKALKEFNRVLKLGGFLLVEVKEKTDKKETAIIVDSLSNHERFFRYYTKEGIQKLIKEAGFEIINFTMREDQYGRSEVKWIEVIGKKLS